MNPKQQRFVEEYLVDLNATQAAIRAGYSKKTARGQASDLLTNPDIAAAIEEGRKALQERTHFTQDRILRELAALALSNVAHFEIDAFGEVTLTDDAPAGAMAAVASIKKRIKTDEAGNTIGVETEIKLWDKPASIRMAGQHLGTFPEHHKHTGKVEMTPGKLEEMTTEQLDARIAELEKKVKSGKRGR